MMESIDLTKQVPERGFFAPSQAMLSLTQVFVEAVRLKTGKVVTTKTLSNVKTLMFVMVDIDIAEVYGILNNGIEVSLQFQGTHNIAGE